MSDGLYSGKQKSEVIAQGALTRHRLLCVNTSPTGVINPRDASTYASLDPNAVLGLLPPDSQEGGPHFVMSPETPDERPTLGFEFCLFQTGMTPTDGPIAVPAGGDFTVTIWALIGNTQVSDGSIVPCWAAFAPLSGVGFNQLYHSFDVNTTVLRFQFQNVAVDGSIGIAFSEL